ncbi:hypothetical protein GGF32_004248 [Allomyces javanicus]|nr:hypothetical protein GGF32_004246 [Allomyces javanicus]KAJ3351548.1 hypothetical protein GGF32_004248 [Allomyces javanicus]
MTYTGASSMAPANDTTDPNPDWDMMPDTRTTPASSIASLPAPTPAPARPARPTSAIPPPRAKPLTTPPRATGGRGLVHSQLIPRAAPTAPMGMAATWAPIVRRDSAAPRGMSRSHSLASDVSEPDSAVGESNPPSGRGSRTASAEPESEVADSGPMHDVVREETVRDTDSDASLDETSMYPTTTYARRAAYTHQLQHLPARALTATAATTAAATRAWPPALAASASASDLSSSYVLSTTTASSLENSTIAHLRRFGTAEQRAALQGKYSWATSREVDEVPETPANSLSVASSDAVQSPVITPTVLDLDEVGASSASGMGMGMGMSVPTTEEGEMDVTGEDAHARSEVAHDGAVPAHAAAAGESATVTPPAGIINDNEHEHAPNHNGVPFAPAAPTVATYVDAVEAWRMHAATTGLDHPSPPRSIATAVSLSDGASTLASTWRSDPTPAAANTVSAALPRHRCPSPASEPRPPQSAAARWVEEDEVEEEMASRTSSSSKGRRRESVEEPMAAVRRRYRASAGATGLPTPTSGTGSASRRSKGSVARRAAARTVEQDEDEDKMEETATRISIVSTAIAALFAWHLTGLVHDCSEQFGTLHWAWTSVRIPIAHGGTLSVPVLHCASHLANVMPVLDLAADMTHTLLHRPAALRTVTAASGHPLSVHHYQLDQLAWAVAERAARLPYARTSAEIDRSDGKHLGQQLTLASESVRRADRTMAALNNYADGALRVLVDVLTALDDAVRADEQLSLPEQVKQVVVAWTDASQETRELLQVEDGRDVALSERATRVVSRARSAWSALRNEVTHLRGLTRDAAMALEAAMARVDASTAAVRDRVWKVDEARSRAQYEQQVREEAVVKAASLQAAAAAATDDDNDKKEDKDEAERGAWPATPPTASPPRAPPEPHDSLRSTASWWRPLFSLLFGPTSAESTAVVEGPPRTAAATDLAAPPAPPTPPSPPTTADVAAAAKAAAAAMAQHRAQDAMLALLRNAHEKVQHAAQDVRGLLVALDAFDTQLLAVREQVTSEGTAGDRGIARAAEHWVDVDRARVAAKIAAVRDVLQSGGVRPIGGRKLGVRGIEAPARGWRDDDDDEEVVVDNGPRSRMPRRREVAV